MKYIKRCLYCNEEFETDMPYKKFCCEEHQHIYNFGIKKGFKGKNLKCKECGKDFTQNRSNQKYCNSECYKDYHYREQHGKDRPKLQIIECKECGKEFKQRRSSQIFCKYLCRNRFRDKNKQQHSKSIEKISPAEKVEKHFNIVEGLDKAEEYKEFIEKRDLEINQLKENNMNVLSKKIENKNEKIEKLNKVITDLLSNSNDRLLKMSKSKIIGFPPKEFYNKFIYVINGEKPIIKWNGNATLDKSEYQKTLNRLENQRKLDNLFYLSKEWLKRSNEVSARDKEKCIYCGKKCHTVHHKKSALYNPELCLDPNNLITVCKRCEGELHFKKRGVNK